MTLLDFNCIKTKLIEGQGETIYEINKDAANSIKLLEEFSEKLNAKIVTICTKEDRAEVLIRKVSEENCIDLRISVCGNVDAGKSTLVGVLTTGEKDNGRGYARQKILCHKHEKENGRTSSVTHKSIGFDCYGNITNYDKDTLRPINKKQMLHESSKLLTMYDLAGHEYYLKTTIYGITSSQPDYAMIVISANNGIQKMTKEHICICLALKIPFFIVITRIDACPENVYKNTVDTIEKLIQLPSVRKLPYHMKNECDILICSKNLEQDKIVPIISVSNVTHKNISNLKKFLNLIPIRKNWDNLSSEPIECVIDSIYHINGVGLVIAGLITKGCISVNDSVNIGPDSTGKYKTIQIRSIEINGINKKKAIAGKVAAFNITKYKGFNIKKGMIILDKRLPTLAIWEFRAEIKILYHSTTIKLGYQPVINFGSIKQSATIIDIENNQILRTGHKAIVKFKFMYYPVYLKLGTRIIFRENKTRGIGTVI